MRKEIIIFGTSPQIDEVKEFIPSLMKKYTTIGINRFPLEYPDVDYWAFVDLYGITNVVTGKDYRGQTVLTDYSYKVAGLLNKYKNYETFMIDACSDRLIRDKLIIEDSVVVAGYGLTMTYVINWCYLQGYTDIYLIGHSTDYIGDGGIRDYLVDAATVVDIYQTDFNNDIGLRTRSIESML